MVVSLLMVGTAKVDHDILRQIGALVATLPVMDVEEFHKELETVRIACFFLVLMR